MGARAAANLEVNPAHHQRLLQNAHGTSTRGHFLTEAGLQFGRRATPARTRTA
jgi:hypothetical protein